jgi:nucleoside-diphosphate-sugar epimerase
MRIIVTGGAGYFGSTLVPLLLDAGHSVTVVDRFFFGKDTLPQVSDGRLALLNEDVRWVHGQTFEGHDAVVDLAALSNDPSGALDPWKTYEINYLGRSRVARLAKEAGVGRYVVSSSCSVYGFQPEMLTEDSHPNPLTAYARANVLIERDILGLSDSKFSATALRFSTLFGLSRRMRFDLAINGMVLGGLKTGKIPVARDGNQWRPFLHVRDASRAILEVLTASPNAVKGGLFNVGSDDQNFQVLPLAELVRDSMNSRPELEWYGDVDTRSYRVSFRKIHDALGFRPAHSAADAVREIEKGISSGQVEPSLRTKTVDWYRHLLSDPAAGDAVRLHGVIL